MHRSIFLYFCFVVYIFGVLVGDLFLKERFEMVLYLMMVFSVSVFVLWRVFVERKIFVLVILGVFSLGCFHLYCAFEEDRSVIMEGRDLTFSGRIVGEVDKRDQFVKYTVESEDVGLGKILVNGERYPVYQYGDLVLISGRVEVPEMIEDFDYRAYLSRYGIYYVVYYADIELVDRGENTGFFGCIYRLKQRFEQQINLVFTEPHSSFMAGLLIGSRRGLSDELMEKFNLTGLTHIVALSGYNITLIVVFIGIVFSFIRRRVRTGFSFVLILMFVIFTGLSASVVRAGIMGVIGLLAIQYGKQYLAIMSLVLSAFLMVVISPKVLMADSGFQLSVMATLGIVVFGERIKRRFEGLGEMLADTLAMTLAAQVFNIPIMMISFGRIAVVSLFANILVLPLLPISMLFGFLSVLLSFVNLTLGRVVGFLAYLILEIVLKIVDIVSQFSFLNFQLELSEEFVLFYYLVFWIYFVFWLRVCREKFVRYHFEQE